MIEKHFVTFFSPGTLVAEQTTKPIDAWNIKRAVAMSREIVERYGAKPYAFQFSTRARGDDDLDSKVTKRSSLYYLGGQVRTVEEIEQAADPSERILLSNMQCNGWKRCVTTTEGWKWTQPLEDGDAVLTGKDLEP